MCNNDLLKIDAKKSLRRRIAHLKTLGAISGLGFTALVTKEANAQNGMPIYAPPVVQPFGLGDFTHPKKITDASNVLSDLDGDGDLDIFSLERFYSFAFLRYIENIGDKNNPKFSSANFNPLGLTDSIFDNDFRDMDIVDIDGDDDLDIFIYDAYLRKTAFLKNIGDKNHFIFDSPLLISNMVNDSNHVNYNNVYTSTFIDFDNDGDKDRIFVPQFNTWPYNANHLDYKIGFCENTGDKFNPILENYTTLNDTFKFNIGNYFKITINVVDNSVIDYDNDGDLDIILCTLNQYFYQDGFYGDRGFFGLFLENKGTNIAPDYELKKLPNINQKDFFEFQKFWYKISNYPHGLAFGDLDGDGDLDLIGTKYSSFHIANIDGVDYYIYDHRGIYFYENLANANNTITGTAFHDENSNGMYEIVDESLMPNMVIAYQNKDMPDIQGIAITDTAGKFIIPALDNVYVLKPSVPEHFQVVPSEIEINAADSNYIYEQHFALQPLVSINDLACQITSGPTRPGFVVPFWLTYKNVGTTKRSGTLVFKKNDLLTFNMASSTPDDISADAYAWNFNNLQPLESKTIYVEMTLSATANLGDTLTTILGIIPIPNDANPTNNLDTLNSIIVGSFDPNDKLVTPTGTGVNGNIPIGTQPLEYTVRFQNTGTDTAFNVVVQDSLDLDFDWSTFKILASSHEVTATTRNNNKIKFTFEDIELPHQAVNEPASYGFVKYSLQPKSGLVAGTKFHNTANIYFDYNAPIETNTTVNTFFVPTGVYDNLQQSYRLFPNPMYEKAVLQFDNIFQETFTLRLVDATGKTIKTLPVDGNQVVIERRDLAPGMYIFTLEGQQTISSGKLMVE